MQIYLIDTENVGWNGLAGAENLKEEDMIYILLGKNLKTNNIKGDLVAKLLRSKAKYILDETQHSGKNYLDFQLSCVVGRYIEKYPSAEIIIISKDQGYKAVIDYLTKNNRKGCEAISIETFLVPSSENIEKETKINKNDTKTSQNFIKKEQKTKEITEEELKIYQSEIVRILTEVFPNKSKATIKKQAIAASKKNAKKELKKYCENNLNDIKFCAYSRICRSFPY